ncbi:cytochrome C [Polaromonas sp.]|uniref:cytochrome C n=1 Tax=Polaromonas sp. TaxID=1869339 RepID=UPI0025DA9C03|nr:cytochrome C [Polaromonas sp.]
MHSMTARAGFHVALAPSLIRRVAFAAFVAAATWAQAQPAPEAVSTRGQLLYSTHCIECHTTQIHWRAQRQAYDWVTLKAQVRRWQGTTGLGWSEADIDDVARHLNDTIYQFARPVSSVGSKPGA